MPILNTAKFIKITECFAKLCKLRVTCGEVPHALQSSSKFAQLSLNRKNGGKRYFG